MKEQESPLDRSPSAGPAYQQIKAALREELTSGAYPPGSAFLTQRALCERFAVSSTTAVRVLNELAADGLLTRRRGRGTFVAEMPAGRKAADSRVPTVACIVHGLSGPYVGDIVRGAQQICRDQGYQLALTETDGSAEREEAALREALSSGAAGILLYPVEGHPHPDLLAEIRMRQVPLVLVDRYREDVVTDAVTADNIDVGHQVTRHLIQLGHERIAALWSETQCTSARDRLAGHFMALREAGLSARPEFTTMQPYVEGAEGPRQAQLAHLLELPDPPTALLCGNGFILAAVAHDLVLLGLDVPGRIDLAGMDTAGPYDILPLAAVTAVLPGLEIGRQASALLARRIAGEDSSPGARHIVLPIEIRTRAEAKVHLRPVRVTSDG